MVEPKSGTRERALLFLVGNLVVGVGVPVAVDLRTTGGLSAYEQTALGLLVFAALTSVELLLRVEQVHASRKAEIALWRQRANLDGLLAEIRAGLHELVADDSLRDSFFLDYYRRELELLRSRVDETISRREVAIDRHHIDSTYVLLSIYDKKEHGVFRATALCSEVTDVFDITYQVYFFEWLKRLKSGQVRSLRRLFIYDELEEMSTGNIAKLIAFHNSGVRGLEAKAIARSEVLRFKSDYHISDGVLDVGIFSDAYVYLGRTRKGENISGSFSRDPETIRVYTSVFDGLWESGMAIPVGDLTAETVTVDQLFDRTFTLGSEVASDMSHEGGVEVERA